MASGYLRISQCGVWVALQSGSRAVHKRLAMDALIPSLSYSVYVLGYTDTCDKCFCPIWKGCSGAALRNPVCSIQAKGDPLSALLFLYVEVFRVQVNIFHSV